MTERDSCRFGDITIEYGVIRSARRKKTIEITLDPFEGVLVAVPMRASKAQIQAVVRRRAGWIVRKANTSDFVPRPRRFGSGESLPYLGRQVRMFVEQPDKKRASVRFDHWSFHVQAPEVLSENGRRSDIRSAFVTWYRRRAVERLPVVVERWSPRVGFDPADVLVRNQRQRWGSCAPDGTLRFNWRIIMAEPGLIDYVVVHEMVHLGQRNHSREFWHALALVMPDYMTRRQRLKEVGPYLAI